MQLKCVLLILLPKRQMSLIYSNPKSFIGTFSVDLNLFLSKFDSLTDWIAKNKSSMELLKKTNLVIWRENDMENKGKSEAEYFPSGDYEVLQITNFWALKF